MKRILTVILFLPFISWGQQELTVNGKMIYGETKSATLQIIELESTSDIITVQIDKKKFKLEPLDTSKEYKLIFTSGGFTKTITIKPVEATEPQNMYLEINWKNL